MTSQHEEEVLKGPHCWSVRQWQADDTYEDLSFWATKELATAELVDREHLPQGAEQEVVLIQIRDSRPKKLSEIGYRTVHVALDGAVDSSNAKAE